MKVSLRFRAASVLSALICFVGLQPCVQAQKHEPAQPRSVIGHVFSRENQPVNKAIVYLKNTKTANIKTYICDPEGSFHFPSLAPNVDYEIYAELSGDRSDTKTLSAFDNRKQINVTLHLK